MRLKAIRLMPVDVRARIAADQRGAITTGYHNGKFPVSLPHFYLKDYPEIRAIYGDNPTKLIIMFPSNDLREFVIAEHNLYLKSKATGKGIKFRYCDGETCAFNCDMAIAGKKFSAEDTAPCVCKQFDLKDKDACKSYFHFKAWVVDPNTSLIISHITFRFETRSPNSRDNILSELKNVLMLTSPDGVAHAEDDFITSGRLIGLYFMLSVKMIEQPGKQAKKFPIWSLQAIGDKNRLLQCAEHAQLPITKAVLALQPGEMQVAEAKLLSSGVDVNYEEEDTVVEQVKTPLVIDSGIEKTYPERTLQELERETLEHTFMDYAQDKTPSQIMVAVKTNWTGDVKNLTSDQLRSAIKKWHLG